jgi:hypothetical protein
MLKRTLTIVMLLLVLSSSAFSQVSRNDSKSETEALITDLYSHPWSGVEMVSESPTIWDFAFTEPMLKILKIGSPTQEALLTKLDDSRIKDQIIILLGGVGDERAVAPIINAMVAESDIQKVQNAERINRSANLALTNITVADVIWHYEGGIVIERCRTNPKECWSNWLRQNEAKFDVKTITQSRRYSNYPNYGIYRQP